MRKLKFALAIASALAIMCSAFSCGKTDETETSDSPIINSESSSDDSVDSDNSEDSDSEGNADNEISENEGSVSEDEDSQENNESSDDKNDGNTSDDKKPQNSDKNENNGGSENKKEENKNTSQSDKKPSSGNTGSSTDKNNSNASGNNDNSNASDDKGSSENKDTQPEPAPPAEAPKTYTAEISVGSSPKFSGSNVTVSGSKVLITAGGDYLLSGSVSDGQVEVNTKEKVKLYLNGVSITNPSGPAIQITDAKRAVFKLVEGTTSTLKDGGKGKVYDGVIYSNDTVEIGGKGTLNITAGNAHGIVSDDDIIIENGTLNITSIKSGLIANDDITINDGKLTIKGGTNGIKSKGTLNINGGYSVVSGGTKEEKSSIYAAGAFNYTGGEMFAAGNTVTAPTKASNPYVVAGFNTSVSSGTQVKLYLNNSSVVSLSPHNNFRCVLMLTPDISSGDKFRIELDGKKYGDYNITTTRNVYTIEK